MRTQDTPRLPWAHRINIRLSGILSQRFFLPLVVFSSLTIISIFAVVNGTYYDDEILNIREVATHSIGQIMSRMNSVDVTPPGSYVINKLLLDVFGSWYLVKIAGGVFNAMGLAVFQYLTFGVLDARKRIALAGLMATAASVVMWGASNRWYAYFNPIFAIALAVLLFSNFSWAVRTVVLAVCAVLLFHISYLAFVAVPVLALVHLGRDFRSLTRRNLVTLAFYGGVALLLCLPQFYVFLTVHLHGPTATDQVSGPASAFAATILTLVWGNAVFPIAALPAIYGIAAVSTFGYLALSKKASRLDWLVLAALVLGVIGMSLTGIGIKPRNSIFLLPLVALLFSSAMISLPKISALIALCVIALFQAQGVVDVIAHQNTIKDSYNSHFLRAMDQIKAWKSNCGRVVVFNHDVVLTYLLEDSRIEQSSPFLKAAKVPHIEKNECGIVVKTYRGWFPAQTVNTFYRTMQQPELEQFGTISLDPDPFAGAKGWMIHETVPPYLIEMDIYRASAPVTVQDWNMIAHRSFNWL